MKFRKYILLCLMLWMAFASRADHAAGGYFEYTCLGNNQYQVDFFFLRDCSGIDFPPNVYFFTSNSCGAACESILVPSYYHTTIDFGCGNNCLENGPTLEGAPSFELVQYRAVLTFPTACADWRVAVSIHARNETTYSPTFGTYYNYCIINNTNDICSSSVRLDGIPVTLGCLNNGGKSMYSIVNTNGGTLEYELVDPLIGMCGGGIYPVPHEGPTSVNRPVPSTADWNISPSGELSYTPNAIGTGYFALKITERNASNTVVGVTVIDGMVFTSPDCEQGSTIDFFDWTNSGGNTITTSSVTEPLCGTFHMVANDDDESITNVIVEAPHFVDYSITYNNDGTVTVDVCADFPDELLCQEIQASITVTGITSDAGCTAIASNAGHKGYYYLVKEKGLYCPDNLYITNRNNQSGILAPVSLRAEERIWVGDAMPAPYNPSQDGPEGPVIVPDNAHYLAGIEIILPSCENPGNDCVTITGDVTLQIAPLSCSSECDPEPIGIYVNELFKCNAERLIAEATGNGPFTYKWEILGQTFESMNSDLNVHDLVSEHNSGYIPYTLTVYDAAGQSGQYTGQILGTKRFYEPIKNNKIYENHDGLAPVYGPSGYYYAGNIGVYSGLPAYAWDDVNTSPPWYGATYMRLKVYGTTSNNVYLNYAVNLQNTDDWSLDNGQFYWNGRVDNTGICVDGQVTDIFTYVLTARNCLEDYFTDQVVMNVDEAASYHVDVCTTAPWNPVVTKSSVDEDGPQYPGGMPDQSRRVLPASENTLDPGEELIWCIPNPTTDEFTFGGNFDSLYDYKILDQTGKIVLEGGATVAGERIIVSHLSSGVYTIVATTSAGSKQFKLIKQ